ncbi:glycerophosphodiester phosphodiesterase [Domibacillus robiginosus]|uniref:glycerophosphodiester phosphodiesterase n=1 Tax=Domibacillus robiginosus TaxID=1071054 RepID=UPI00067DCBE7|nr:glycerophosphodiester phosphodiesterase [Domibacillus robiginosus]
MKTLIYGHRGAKGSFPENTLLSFQQAIEQGADGLELDVHITMDGEVVVIHDETLDRTTDGSGVVSEKTAADIRTYSAGVRFAHLPQYKPFWDEERVPSLQQVLQYLAPYDVELNIELKTYSVPYEGIEKRVLDVVRRYGGGRKIVYSSFHLPTLIRLSNQEPGAETAWLLNAPISRPGDYLDTFGFEALHIGKEVFFSNEAHFARWADRLRVWTVNDPYDIQRLITAGVGSIITDVPDVALAIRYEQETVRQ